ncbi:ATP-binding protein [Nitrincola iocasae]|uniref:histidine kinase n=1 Tax=Nitrincola iocasae TaxID=2614693 RepID=A0A5J6LE62_9GAMM|nr:transporter substrate-binding domain-containing protein [Nitrincola iocasae]QEW06797.1 transporter substrate-binding domain-containing protein [Nitrincola iocasae]
MLSGSSLRLVGVLLLSYLIITAPHAFAQSYPEPNLNEVQPLVIAQDRAWPPFAFVGEDGEPRGLLIELWREIAAAMGRPVEFHLVDWPDSIQAVKDGRAHVHGGLFYSEERATFMKFSDTMLPLSGYLFVPSGAPLTGFDDLHDKVIGVTEGSYEMDYVQRHHPDQPIRVYRSNELVVMAALAGEVAAYVADYPVSMYLLDRHGHPSNFHPLVQLYTQGLLAGVALEDEALLQEIDQAIQKLDPDFLSQLSYRWLRSELVVEVVPRWFIALLVVTLLLLLLLAYTLFLSRQRRQIQQLVSIQSQALQENEHLFQSLIENANDIIYIISADATIGYLSAEWVSVTGYSLEEAVGQPFSDYVHPDDIPFLVECHERTLQGGRLSGLVFRLVDVHGQVHDMIANESSALNAQGEVTYYMGIARDITERKRIEAEMEQRREMLEDTKVKLEKEITERSRIAKDLEVAQARVARALEEEQKVTVAQKQFLQIVTHEFRTPLAVIQSLGDLLELEVSNDPQVRQKHIARLKSAVQRMANLLNKALGQERIETTFWRTNAAWFDIKALLQELVSEAARLNGDSRRFRINSMSRRIQADRELLIICINNLLDNAIKFSPSQSEIFISAYIDAQDRICISVIDQGKGIEEQDRCKVFGKYYRQDAQTNPGLGLGLYLVDQIIRLHGGDVIVTNAPGAGACFTLRIPN